MGDIETIILENLLHNENFSRKALPFLKSEYFPDKASGLVFTQTNEFVAKYNSLPTVDELIVEIKGKRGLSQGDFEETIELLQTLTKKNSAPSIDWLIENTEKFCRNRAIYNTVLSAAEKLTDDISTDINLGEIPEELQSALGITFNTTVGLSYEEADERWDRRKQRKVEKVSFSLHVMNEATNGGMNLKTISCIAAGTGAGKSAFMCAQSAYSILNGVDTLYITLEMDEDSIADRIDANIIGVPLDDIPNLSKQDFTKRLKNKLNGVDNLGKLIIKEYPTCGAGVMEFRALLNELKLKKNFTPRLVVVDYLNICNSSRYKGAANINSYTLVKAIAEELRGLAKEFNCAILTGTQLNRDGVDNTNVSLKEISESSGLSHTVDMLFALMRTEELDSINQVMIKQLKNRFADMAKMLRFVFGVDRAKFRYYDVDQSGDGVNEMAQPKQVKDRDPLAESDIEDNAWQGGNFGVGKRQKKNFSGLNA